MGRIAGDHRNAVMIMAVNRVIRPVSMELTEEWYEDSYISTLYRADTLPSTLSRVMSAIGSMNLNHSFLDEIVNVTGKSGALYYDLTSYSSQSRNIEFLEHRYSKSDQDFPQVKVSPVESSKSDIPIFYDIYPGSVVDITTVKNTVATLISAGLKDITFVPDVGMFSTSNIEHLLFSRLAFITLVSYTTKEVRRVVFLSRMTIEKGGNIIRVGGEIMFAMNGMLRIGNKDVIVWIYYSPDLDRKGRLAVYSALQDRIERLSTRTVKKWDRPRDVREKIVGTVCELHLLEIRLLLSLEGEGQCCITES